MRKLPVRRFGFRKNASHTTGTLGDSCAGMDNYLTDAIENIST